MVKAKSRKKVRRSVPHGMVHVKATYNNTIITLTDEKGDVLGWSSSGANGFKGPRKATPYAAQTNAEKVAQVANLYGVQSVDVLVKGVGSGREQAIRGIEANGITITSITDMTPMPHNGCRRKKPRRV
ncbi:MAG: 30S ribosomal protein S11 [Patescibacteria group bacterium]|nr:30S ribosomal protein S11 [Patescibacteria group bacterium]